MFNTIFWHIGYPKSRFNGYPEALSAYDKFMYDGIVGDGSHGMREIKQEAPNVENLLPATRGASVYYQKKTKD
jgi:hypothetical protein